MIAYEILYLDPDGAISRCDMSGVDWVGPSRARLEQAIENDRLFGNGTYIVGESRPGGFIGNWFVVDVDGRNIDGA